MTDADHAIVKIEADPEVQTITASVREIVANTPALKIVTAEDYQHAADGLQIVKGAIRQLEGARLRITRPMNESLREVNEQARRTSEPLVRTEVLLKDKLLGYTREQERIRREAQAREEERARKEREALIARAAKAEEKGKTEQAQALVERAETVVAPVLATTTPKVKGLAMRKVWKYRVVNPLAIKREFLKLDESMVDRIVQSLKSDAPAVVGGIEVYEEEALASRAR